MRTIIALLFALGLSGGVSAAQDRRQPKDDSQEVPRFEETLVVTASPRSGSPSDHFMTFSGPVGVPGVTLPAGTYIFRFTEDGKDVLQVLKADRSNAYAMFHTIPIRDLSRDLFTETYDVKWRERAEDAPPAIDAWFVPYQSTGYEFIYPDDDES